MSNLLTNEVKQALRLPDKGKLLIITIGNPLRSDDGVGPYIYGHVKSGISPVMLNAGDKPENIIDEATAVKPAKTVIIDAADFKGEVGEVRVIQVEHIPASTLSTHSFPLGIIAQLLKEDTGSEVVFLGIQASQMNLGETIDKRVLASANLLIDFINTI